MTPRTVRARIAGVVQGVGFRPFLHRLVKEYGLGGRVQNTADGVTLLLSGDSPAIDAALAALTARAPALARVEAVEVCDLPYTPYADFQIEPSVGGAQKHALITPDAGLCADCARELFDPADRRYRYPFINCTNCGPRFTIVRDIPYDRANTTMAGFTMCPACAAEYADVADRRYHAQPDCCAACGPGLFYLDGNGARVAGDPMALATAALAAGKLLCVKGLGGMHLCCLPTPELVAVLRARKGRDERPFALMCRDMAAVRELCPVSEEESAALKSPARPIVLLPKGKAGMAHVSENGYLGVMLPYTPLHALLMEHFPTLVMTSANLFERPILYQNDEAVTLLQGVADGFLLHDRDIEARCDDSLLWALSDGPYFLRRSRGYAPAPLTLAASVPPLLACGAEQKASFALSKGDKVFLSQHIGDLKNFETYSHYEAQIQRFERLFDIAPTAVACDLHPDYLSTAYAEAACLPLVRVQHHHAHMASCMADNRLSGPCIGLVWDGVGLGTDGLAWGGECLMGDYASFTRLGSIRPLRLPGGDAAVREIFRCGVSLLADAGLAPEDFLPDAGPICALLAAGRNCPPSSGMGRLFDGVYALLTARRAVSYEGQGAVLLEAMAASGETGFYPPEFAEAGDLTVFDTRPLIRALVKDLGAGVPAPVLCARFMNTLVEMACCACERARGATGLQTVVLSGGVFQNLYLLPRVQRALAGRGFGVYHHSRTSTNDEGIALGQLAVAAARFQQ